MGTRWLWAPPQRHFVAAVILTIGQFFYTKLRMDENFIAQLIPREDAHIGMLEIVAVWLLLNTFGEDLHSHRLLLFIDNQGCLYASIKAASRAPENNKMVAHFWLFCTRRQIDVRAFYVESKASSRTGPRATSSVS